jgi:hypothetical protein
MKLDITKLPEQNIGAITLNIQNGPYGTQLNTNSKYSDWNKNLLFRGYALSTSNNVS